MLKRISYYYQSWKQFCWLLYCGDCDTLPFKSLSLVKKKKGKKNKLTCLFSNVNLIKSDSKDVKNDSIYSIVLQIIFFPQGGTNLPQFNEF